MRAVKERGSYPTINTKPISRKENNHSFFGNNNNIQLNSFFSPAIIQPNLTIRKANDKDGKQVVQRKCTACEKEEALIQRMPSPGNNQNLPSAASKPFSCADSAGDTKLEACLNDQDWLEPGDKGAAVGKVQRGLNSNLQDKWHYT